MDRPTLIVNPAARGGKSSESEALSAFGVLGVAVNLVRTTAPGDAGRIASAHEGDAPVYTLGGDGTAMEAVGALVGRNVAVGVLPGGTGNQLARHFGIPLSVGAAVRALHRGHAKPMSLGRMSDGRLFSLTAGFGYDAAMIAATTKPAKRRWGAAAYIGSALRVLSSATPFAFEAEVDGQRIERTARLVMIANVSDLFGGKLVLAPRVPDGPASLCLCAVNWTGSIGGALNGLRSLLRNFDDTPDRLFRRGAHVVVRVPAGTPGQVDGEIVNGTEFDARALENGARFLVPGD